MIQLPTPSHQYQWSTPPSVRVIFVGDTPSKDNIDPEVAFEGTRSWTTLQEWIKFLGLNEWEYEKTNRTSQLFLRLLDLYPKAKIVALGNEASQALNLINKPHFKLPHPSGRNRLLNDKEYVWAMLRECRQYLNNDPK